MTSIFVMFNTYLYCRIISSYFDQVLLSFGTMGCLVLSIVYSNYNWAYARGFDVMFLIFYSCIGMVLVFIFGYIQTNVNNEGQEETRLHYRQQDEFRVMFDSLQSGVILINPRQEVIEFTN